MISDININLIKTHFFLEKSNSDKNNENNKYKSKIILHDFLSVNEANISDIVKTIPYYQNNYNVLENYNYINLAQLDERLIILNNIPLHENKENKDKKYLIFQYFNQKALYFHEFMFNLNTPGQFIMHLNDSYKYLLNSLIQLNNNICFFNLSSNNIIYYENHGYKPLLYNFGNSILLSKMNISYISKLIKNTYDYSHKPIEIHVLFYLIENNLHSLNDNLIENIVDNFIGNLNILKFFSQKYKESYKNTCIAFLKIYIDMPKEDIINDILNYSFSWDNYSLSILFLHIICNFTDFFSLKETFMNKFIIILLKNIHPFPNKRENLQTTLKNFENLFYEFTDWSFVNTISQNKMPDFYDCV